MPAKSKKQERLMQAVCHNASFAKKVGIKQSVGCEFVGDSVKPTFKSFLIAERLMEVLSTKEVDTLIDDLESGKEISEAKKGVSDSTAAAVYHRDYLKRKKKHHKK